MATAWKFASISKACRGSQRRGAASAAALLALAFAAAPATAGLSLDPLTGHLAFGYSRAFITGSPGGSISVAGGVDYALNSRFGLVADLGYDLLGGNDVKRDTLTGTVDYSLFEASMRLRWNPDRLGPIHRISVGPALFAANSEVSTPFGGLPFDDLVIHEIAPGAALDLTLISAQPKRVRVGLELGTRILFLKHETWSLGSARLAFHY